MISIYGLYIFMIIVEVSNSIRLNYSVIKDVRSKPYLINRMADDSYNCYRSNYDYIGVQMLDPLDYFLSIYNPYYYFIPSKKPEQSVLNSYLIINQGHVFYQEKLKNLPCSLNVPCTELRYIGIDPENWDKRLQFVGTNLKLMEIFSLSNLISAYNKNFKPNKDKINNLTREKPFGPLDQYPRLTVDELVTEDQEPPEFYNLSKDGIEILDILNDHLPRNEESDEDYLRRHKETVTHYLHFNKHIYEAVKNNPIKDMHKKRLKLLKLPFLLRNEPYNFYVLRMKHMGIIPFHLDFLKAKYDVFKTWSQKNIFEELGIDKVDVIAR
ncbi:uncharacterized protein LOC111039184 isoform X3 [Myzus persicae]|uniref:uncharacterized protein LOC111039184 isoform X3 n=1 Tax=Myzus persicae TaxID=13164 RepID=UPI000B932295|nr:uncharacterized protein LOC111039184 isoform X3 [Myzus persicae]